MIFKPRITMLYKNIFLQLTFVNAANIGTVDTGKE
jgi:hypothetical protein